MVGQIVTAAGSRLVLNTGRRFAYPFAPALSRGLNVPLTAVTSLIAAMQFTGLLGALSGPLADTWGYRKMMLAALAMLAAGLLAVWVAPVYFVVMAGLILAGFAKNVFDPAIYGYVGQRIAFNQRGRAIGVLEFAWAGSALVGIPLVGILMAARGWQAPFWMLGCCGIAAMGFILWVFPKDRIDPNAGQRPDWRRAWSELVRERQALGLLGFVFFVSLGNDQLFVVYGAWMEQSFKIGVAAIGLGTGVIGVAELLGEGFTVVLGDRIGLRRATLGGSILSAAAYGLMPFLNTSISLALAGLFLVFLTFEFTMVCGISLSTEALPRHRATMMAAFLAMAGMGRVFGALAGGLLWQVGGIAAVGTACALAALLGAVCLYWGKRMKPDPILDSKI
ncbi:MAG: MFS transporter [Desulfosarcinaceae bacterium]